MRRCDSIWGRAERLLAVGMLLVVDLVEKPGEVGLDGALSAVKTELQSLENGEAFINQIETARRVFSG